MNLVLSYREDKIVHGHRRKKIKHQKKREKRRKA